MLYAGDRDIDNQYRQKPRQGLLAEDTIVIVFKTNSIDIAKNSKMNTGQEKPWFTLDREVVTSGCSLEMMSPLIMAYGPIFYDIIPKELSPENSVILVLNNCWSEKS